MDKAGPAPILVVDDDRSITRILRSMLEIEGYRVEEASSSVGLVDRIEKSPPSLILLDVYMPELSGLEVLSALRRRLGASVAVVMLTGESENVEVAVEALRQGALDYLIKPVPMDRLLSVVRASLRIHGLERDRERSQAEAVAARGELDRVRARSAMAEQAWRALLDRLPGGWLEIDASGSVVHLSPGAAELLGQTPAGSPRLRGVAIDALAPALGRLLAREGSSLRATDEDELEVPGADGVRRRLRIRTLMLSPGQAAGPESLSDARAVFLREVKEASTPGRERPRRRRPSPGPGSATR